MIKRCFCTPSKASVIVVTLLWLVQGILIIKKIVECSLKFNLSEIEAVINHIYLIPIFIIYGLMIVGALFGLLVINCTKTSMMLFLYSKVARIIARSNIIGINILTIVEIVFQGSEILGECQNLSHICNHEYYYTRSISDKCQGLGYVCNQKYFDIIRTIILYALASILLSMYSAIIISGYAHKIRDKEEIKKMLQEMITKT
ncbi:hypothetical protein RclHR1_03430007 [Rhizophagus clarus]|uniref:MARVEL domain-containing protein n=1 Tax=Rhizophagus clarus TaxID=94130 RepID=A0A2Z6S4F4_9GLOM|nr:hypothetical protein RclHR1_03430007 [Rhizophagus clarus]